MDIIDASLTRWHAFVKAPTYDGVAALLDPDVIFRSPFAYTPHAGRTPVAGILATVATVFVDFKYHRQFQAGDSVALEFSARVGELELKGIDLIRFGADGQIVEFEVMIRPANALLALGQEMGRRLAAQG
jgi:hypothetical protein